MLGPVLLKALDRRHFNMPTAVSGIQPSATELQLFHLFPVCRFLGSDDRETFFKTTQRHQVVSSDPRMIDFINDCLCGLGMVLSYSSRSQNLVSDSS